MKSAQIHRFGDYVAVYLSKGGEGLYDAQIHRFGDCFATYLQKVRLSI